MAGIGGKPSGGLFGSAAPEPKKEEAQKKEGTDAAKALGNLTVTDSKPEDKTASQPAATAPK